MKKCPSSIQYWDSNPRPLERESRSITTRPVISRKVPNLELGGFKRWITDAERSTSTAISRHMQLIVRF